MCTGLAHHAARVEGAAGRTPHAASRASPAPAATSPTSRSAGPPACHAGARAATLLSVPHSTRCASVPPLSTRAAGVATLAALRDGLVAVGLPAATPAAFIERGGTDAQRVLRGTVADVVARAPAWHAGGPALLLVGGVAAETEKGRLAA